MIRPADIEDASSIARIHVEGWQQAYTGIVPQSHLDSLSVEQRATRWVQNIVEARTHTLVYEDADQVTGWIGFGPNRGDEDIHEIGGIYVCPHHWGQGVGRKLMTAAEEILLKERVEDIVLWVLKDNQAGIAFYRKLGYEQDGAEKQDKIGGTMLTEVRMRKHAPRGR